MDHTLSSAYLVLDQASYAIAALPIGTVLSIAPLYLNEVLQVEASFVGILMALGELLGIVFMKYAELSTRGFLLRRPNDMILILVVLAGCLSLIPVWTQSCWYMSAAFMILVQSFNSASKPVIAEAVHRKAIKTGNQPSKAFARANQWRRIGNACIGALSPLAYIVNPRLMFFIVPPALLSFTAVRICFTQMISREVVTASKQRSARHSTCRTEMDLMRHGKKTPLSALEIFSQQQAGIDDTDGAEAAAGGSSWSSWELMQLRDNPAIEIQVEGCPADPRAMHGSTDPPLIARSFLMQLVVLVFPVLDAFVSRLPFAFMTIAITESAEGKLTACAALFSYQSARAVSQYIQTCCIGPRVCFALTFVALVAYAAMLIMLWTDVSAKLWYVPIALAGLAETLPVQQYFLIRLLQVSEDSSEELKNRARELVKQSHTGTGIGSAVAFFGSSRCYQAFGLYGVAVLGFGVASLKLLTEATISTAISMKHAGDHSHAA